MLFGPLVTGFPDRRSRGRAAGEHVSRPDPRVIGLLDVSRALERRRPDDARAAAELREVGEYVSRPDARAVTQRCEVVSRLDALSALPG